jgi:hypothetical protein
MKIAQSFSAIMPKNLSAQSTIAPGISPMRVGKPPPVLANRDGTIERAALFFCGIP